MFLKCKNKTDQTSFEAKIFEELYHLIFQTYAQPSSTTVHKTNRIEHSQLITEQNLKSEQLRIEQELLEVENKRRLKELQLAQQKLQAEREAFDAKLRQDEQERERLRYVEQQNFAETEQRLKLQEQEQQKINQERKKLQQENDFDREQQRLQLKYQELQRQKEAYEKQKQSFDNSNHIKITTVEQVGQNMISGNCFLNFFTFQNVPRYDSNQQSNDVNGNDSRYEQISPAIITSRYRDASPGSWKKIWFVEPTDEIVKNTIPQSTEILEDEKYDIDWWRRRDTFIEKPKPDPIITHTNRWQPPPEVPYVFPKRRPPSKHFLPRDDKEYKWEPYLVEPEYKYEQNVFYPLDIPPNIPSESGSLKWQHKPQYQSQSTPPQTPIKPQRGAQPVGRGPFSGFPPVQIYNVSGVDSRVYEFRSTPSPYSNQDGMQVNKEIAQYQNGREFDGSRTNTPSSYERNRINRSATHTPSYPENESTPRHPSTLTVFDRPHVDLGRKIEIFEPQPLDPRLTPIHQFGVPLQTSTSNERVASVKFVEPSMAKF